MYLLCLLFICSFGIAPQASTEPWGKDADLCASHRTNFTSDNALTGHLFVEIAEILINFHQNIISPADGPRSHYLPSSSQYTLEAIRSKGFFSGFVMGCDRLMRENSDLWVYRTACNDQGKIMKWDPVK